MITYVEYQNEDHAVDMASQNDKDKHKKHQRGSQYSRIDTYVNKVIGYKQKPLMNDMFGEYLSFLTSNLKGRFLVIIRCFCSSRLSLRTLGGGLP